MDHYTIDAPRLDWVLVPARGAPASGDAAAHLVLWDLHRGLPAPLGSEALAAEVGADSPLGLAPHGFVLHEVTVPGEAARHVWYESASPLIALVDHARARVSPSIDFDSDRDGWRSVRRCGARDPRGLWYEVLGVRPEGDRAVVTIAELHRVRDEPEVDVRTLSPSDCLGDDLWAEVRVPRAAFRSEYERALGIERT